MIYLKSYCYSSHELPFVIANLDEGYDYIDKLILYEYNYTHTGIKKDYEMEKVIHLVPEKLRKKLDYKKIDLTNYIEYAYESNEKNSSIIHNINEPIQRSWLFNDLSYNLMDDDIIIDTDIDEIIYSKNYPNLLYELKLKNEPFSIKLNQFFFKHTYLWSDLIFTSPTIYKYKMVKYENKKIKSLFIKNLRDLSLKSDEICGCHMSWVMNIEFMINKLHYYSHPEYRKFSNKEVLQKAIEEKKYIFDLERPFDIIQLDLNDDRIPKVLQKKDIFDYLV
jgi:hypothetical protein